MEFTERARKNDPPTSHERADKINKSNCNAYQAREVLKCIQRYPDRTAHWIGMEMYNVSGELCRTKWPHKLASRMEKAGWIEREDKKGGMTMKITQKGVEQIK